MTVQLRSDVGRQRRPTRNSAKVVDDEYLPCFLVANIVLNVQSDRNATVEHDLDLVLRKDASDQHVTFVLCLLTGRLPFFVVNFDHGWSPLTVG
jgi:hypothetical protein